jgi:uncharacterized protein
MLYETSFLGRGWSFPPSFSKKNKRLAMVSEEDDIKESLEILLSTSPGERVMQPEYGCNIKSLLFEGFSLSMQALAKEMIRKSILFFETRVIVNSINVDVVDKNAGLLKIIIDYTVQSTNTRFNMVYPYYLKEGTGIDQR